MDARMTPQSTRNVGTATVLPMSGTGPRTYDYLDPTEDPRAKR